MKITEDSPVRMVVLCHQTIWIAVCPGLMAILMAAVAVRQEQWALLWAAAGFIAFCWFFIQRDVLEIDKLSRHVAFSSLRPFGLRVTHFEFDEVKDVVFEESGISFRPALSTSAGVFPLTAWYSQGSPRGQEKLRIRILIALDKLRPGLLS